MNRVQWRIGDRIALLQDYSGLSAGAQGVITAVYETEPDLYRVRFDASAHELPMYAYYLTFLTRPTDAIDGMTQEA